MAKQSAVRQAAMEMERIDTHSHLQQDYGPFTRPGGEKLHFPTSQGVSNTRVAAEGCRVLYGVDPGRFIRPDAPEEIFEKAAQLRAKGQWEAIRHAMDVANIRKQLAFTDFKGGPLVFADQDKGERLAYLAYIDGCISGHGEYPCPDMDEEYNYYEHLCRYHGKLAHLDDMLDNIDAGVDAWRDKNIVGMKTAIAYTSGLAVSDPTLDEARAAFTKAGDMDDEDFRTVHDYAFRHAVAACQRNGQPVVIHTGFQIWGHSPLGQSNPAHLHNLLINLPPPPTKTRLTSEVGQQLQRILAGAGTRGLGQTVMLLNPQTLELNAPGSTEPVPVSGPGKVLRASYDNADVIKDRLRFFHVK